MVVGWLLVVGLLVWAGRNKDRILAWYVRRSMAASKATWPEAAERQSKHRYHG